jgi:2-amino-4-hydroxy-6-hydroxymethyldihydropteridine diphosphokinase
MAIVYLCLGSNKGDRVGYIQQATSLLAEVDGISLIRTSSLYETQPWLEMESNWYVNAVIEVKTSLSPSDLLAECQRVEKQLGRNRDEEGRYGERTADIDILFYGKEIVTEPDLDIPHKFMHQRAFTLVPMLELNPDFIHPILGVSMADLHEELENPEMVYLYGTRVDGL